MLPAKHPINEKNIGQANSSLMTLCRERGRIVAQDTVIFHQGDSVEGFFRVNSGVVMVYRLLQNTQRQISGFYTEGDYFGLSRQDDYTDTAVTISTSNIATLSMNDALANRVRQEELFDATCAQLEAAQELVNLLKKKTASEKVASFLVMLARRQKDTTPPFGLHLPMSRLDIADYLGMTVETVSRRFTEMKRHGIIELPNRHRVTVVKYDQLKIMAETP